MVKRLQRELINPLFNNHQIKTMNQHQKIIKREETSIEFENVTISYGKFEAVRNIFFDIPRYKVTALIGPSGCGKSTVLRSLNRMNDLIKGCTLSGRVLFEGHDLYSPLIDPVEESSGFGAKFRRLMQTKIF